MNFTGNQRGARAEGDIIGRDQTNNYVVQRPLTVIERLLSKLQQEMGENAKIQHTIEALARYHRNRSVDGVVGLEAKLHKAGRSSEYLDPIEKKEMFAKLLERWSLYASAQEIFAHLLARADHEFNYVIHPQIADLTVAQTNQLVTEKVVEPTVADCGASVFRIDHCLALGMLYWLAEQCFVRWHA